MRRWRIPFLALPLATGLLLAASTTNAQAPSPPTYYQKASIPIPTWDGLDTLSVDISWVNPATKTLAVADRSPNGGTVEIFDTARDRFVRAAALGQLAGVVPNQRGGPNGVVFVSPTEVAAGDGDSTLKIININTDAVQSVSTGGERRVDEMAYDPATDRLLAANDRESPPFLTVFKVHPLSILGQIPFPQNLEGIEQPLLAGPGRFWVAIPGTQDNPGGEIDLINTDTISIEQVVSAGDCRPTGLAFGVAGRLVTGGGGCVIDPRSGSIVKIPNGGGDEIATLPSLGVYAFAIAASGTLNLADGNTNQVYQQLPVEGNRNVAADDTTGEIFVPDYATRSLIVFAPKGGVGK